MTRKQIEKFAISYPYPTGYVEVLLKKYNFDTVVYKILCGSSANVVKKVQSCL